MIFDEQVLEFGRIRELVAGHCVSELGRRRVWDAQPRIDRDEIEREMELVREMMNLMSRRREPPIHGLRDVAGHIARVARERAILEPLELLDIKEFLETARHVQHFFGAEAVDVPRLAELARSLESLPSLRRSIDEKIAPDGTVRDGASETLRVLRREIFACEQRIQTVLQRMIRELTDSGDLQDSFFTLRNSRYVLPVKTTNRNRVPGLIHDSSNTGETVFIEPYAILDDSNRLSELRVKEREEIYRILLRVAGHMRDELPVLQTDLVILSELDYIYGKARFGLQHGCTFPKLLPAGRALRLVATHHPLLRAASPEQSRPLSLELKPENKVLVITGPNAGGKTTALKTIGLTVLMTQCAIPAPLGPESALPIFSDVLADIGDEQSVLEGVSTFSAHMQRIARILREAGRASLVLLDELGTATDPAEGGALAVAILERLAEIGGLTVVSTHLAVLKSWAEEHPAGRNASFRLSHVDHRPTFQLILDLPGISEAFVIAEQVGLPCVIIERARALRPQVEHDATALLLSLQAKEDELQQRLAHMERLREDLEIERGLLADEKKAVEEMRRKLKKDMLAEKEAALREAKARIEELIAKQPTKQELAHARKEIEAEIQTTAKERTQLEEEPSVNPGDLQKGMVVRLRSLHAEGRVVHVDVRKGVVTVDLNGALSTVSLKEIEAAVSQGSQSGAQNTAVIRHIRASCDTLDLHGKTWEEARPLLEKFLDQAIVSGLPSVRVVHGHGKGMLRKAVREFLEQEPYVAKIYFAPPAQGGTAATIVEFKD